jgi:hypothetical protein
MMVAGSVLNGTVFTGTVVDTVLFGRLGTVVSGTAAGGVACGASALRLGTPVETIGMEIACVVLHDGSEAAKAVPNPRRRVPPTNIPATSLGLMAFLFTFMLHHLPLIGLRSRRRFR